MHILYLMPAEGFGGAERQGIIHIRGLRKQGHRVTAVVGRSAPMLQQLEPPNDDTVWLDEFPPRHTATTAWHAQCRLAYQWSLSVQRNVRLVQRIASSRSVDIIVANRTYAWFIAVLVAKRVGLPFALRAGSRPRTPWMPRLLQCTRWLHSEPSLFISNCEAVEQSFAQYVSCPKIIVKNAVELDEVRPVNFNESCQRLALNPARPRVALAVRPSAEKGIEMLCRAAVLMREVRPDIEIDIAGDYWQRQWCEQMVRHAGLEGTIVFLGHIDRIADLYGASHVVLLPSRSDSIEGSPNALLEAMACGKAIVATAVGGVPELVEHGREGLLVADGDAQGMAAAVLEILEDRCIRQGMGRAGQLKAKGEHSVPIVVEQLARALERCLVSNGTRLGGSRCE